MINLPLENNTGLLLNIFKKKLIVNSLLNYFFDLENY